MELARRYQAYGKIVHYQATYQQNNSQLPDVRN